MKIIAMFTVEHGRKYHDYYTVDLENGQTVTIRVMDDSTFEGEFIRADIEKIRKTTEIKRIPKIVKTMVKKFIEDNNQSCVTMKKNVRESKHKYEPEYKTGADDVGGIYDARSIY